MSLPEERRSGRLPAWFRKLPPKAPQLATLGSHFAETGVYTVCQSARCPNLGECFARGNATFMIMGSTCTRNCRFCAVEPGIPGPLDPAEPERVAAAARPLGLRHVVITSVTRDDLPDGGAGHFATTVDEVQRALPQARVEVLTSDFGGNSKALQTVLASAPFVFGHNVETVPRLYSAVRPQADYARSLRVLAEAREITPAVNTKSGFMVGLGETEGEVLHLLSDLRSVGVKAVTIGQYLQPTREHLPIVEYIVPERFERYGAAARSLGFEHVFSGPLVRSSYHAEELIGEHDCGSSPTPQAGITPVEA